MQTDRSSYNRKICSNLCERINFCAFLLVSDVLRIPDKFTISRHVLDENLTMVFSANLLTEEPLYGMF